MLYADTRHGRIEAEPGIAGNCPQCGTLDELIDLIATRGGLGPAEAVPLFTPPSATRYADYTR